jgi:uncharacterized protein
MKKKIEGVTYPLVEKKSGISGRGLFAVNNIPWGVKLMEYKGAVISNEEAKKRIAEGADAIMDLENGYNIDGFDKGNGAALINHSRRRPNCFLLRHKGRVWIVSGIDGIKGGEELTYDYGSDYYPRKGSRKK